MVIYPSSQLRLEVLFPLNVSSSFYADQAHHRRPTIRCPIPTSQELRSRELAGAL